jgi:alpha-ketoglutarate-dependent taurine dioxygenase
MATVETLPLEKLTPTVGAEVLDVDFQRVVEDESLPGAVMNALEDHGVLVFRELNLDDQTQAAFCSKLGEIRLWPNSPIPEIFEISLNPENPYVKQLDPRGTINWHIDGTIDQNMPTKATILSAKVVAPEGGETEFASSYAAFDDLPAEEQERCLKLRVVHSLKAARRPAFPNPTPEQLAEWDAKGTPERPLVWTHASGRRSLVLGESCDYVVDMDLDDGRRLLRDLLGRATREERVYRHKWSVGDMLIWDNTGVLHRATPYDPASRRTMHRCTIFGTEPIQ